MSVSENQTILISKVTKFMLTALYKKNCFHTSQSIAILVKIKMTSIYKNSFVFLLLLFSKNM